MRWRLVLGLAAASLAAALPAAAKCKLTKVADVPVTMMGLKPVVTVTINGQEARLVADSGAFFSVLTTEAATRLGVRSRAGPGGVRVGGVGGEETMELGTAKEIKFVGLTGKNYDFLIGGRNVGNQVDGFLGQNMLGGVEAEYDLAKGVLRLFKSQDCETDVLAYWATQVSPGIVPISRMTPLDRHITSTAKINGQSIKVGFDTGASRTILKRTTAERLGIRRDGEGVVAGGLSEGFGRKLAESWIAPVDSFEIADEKIQHTRLRVADISLENVDMLIGADFFLSHRVMISPTQHKLYFTYNGGPVFRLDRVGTPQTEASAGSAPAEAATNDASPNDAAGYSRRGAAFLARRDFAGAIADFGKAAVLEPKVGRHLLDRARARLGARQPVLAMADLNEALTLTPDDRDAHLLRGELYLANQDAARAQDDFAAAIKAAPGDAAISLRIASVYVRAGRFETALAHYDHAIAEIPRGAPSAQALNGRCWARALWGRDLEKALVDCNAALKQGPRTASMLDSRGLVYLRMGQTDQAIADYDDAIRLQPKSVWSLYGRGLAKQRKGLKAEADADLAAAATLAPGLAQQARRYGVV